MQEIYLRDVIYMIWRSKWWIIAATLATVSAAVVLYTSAVPRYRITMTLMPASSSQNSLGRELASTASIAGQFLGVSIGDQRAQTAEQFLAVFRSPIVLEQVDKKLNLLPHLFPDLWNASSKQWVEPPWTARPRDLLRKDIPWHPPNLADAERYLERRMSVETLRGSALVEISITDRDTAFGISLLEALYHESDELMRNRARIRNDEYINYIQKTLSSVGYAETRQSLTALLTDELGKKIMINSNSPYAMEILKPPFADPREVSPSLRLYVLIALAAGFILGLTISLSLPKRSARSSRNVEEKVPQALSEVPVV